MKRSLVHDRDIDVLDFIKFWEHKCWIAGGAARSWYENQPVEAGSDIDIFFASYEDITKMKNFLDDCASGNILTSFSMFDSFFHSNTDKPKKKPSLTYSVTKLFQSSNAVTYSVTHQHSGYVHRIQLICKRYFTSPEEVIQGFDITVCQVATDGFNYWVGDDFYHDLKNRKLRFINKQPDQLKRLVKYWVYGFEPDMEVLENIVTDDTMKMEFNNSQEEYDNAF